MASIANPCMRAMWFKFRWARISNFPRRVKRIFELGNACEEIVKQHLIDVGIRITDEQKPVPGWGGHVWGFIDGIADNVPEAPKTSHLWECKSMNDRIFKTVVKKGVKEAKLEHYVQMQLYMGKLKLTRGLYTAINKNDSTIYPERVYFNEFDYREYMLRGIEVVTHEQAPPNLFQDQTKQACKWCDFAAICYQGEPIQKSCRSCVHADIEEEGKWSCSHYGCELSFEVQHLTHCPKYKQLEIG